MTFNDLAMTFLNHFQLPMHYDVGTELLLTFRQDKVTHISNHIQEWHKPAQPMLPFLTTLNLPDLSRLMNDPVSHDPA